MFPCLLEIDIEQGNDSDECDCRSEIVCVRTGLKLFEDGVSGEVGVGVWKGPDLVGKNRLPGPPKGS